MVDGPNMYNYAGGDPVNRWDPMGTDWKWNAGKGYWDEIPNTPEIPAPDFPGFSDGEVWNTNSINAMMEEVSLMVSDKLSMVHKNSGGGGIEAYSGLNQMQLFLRSYVEWRFARRILPIAQQKWAVAGFLDFTGSTHLTNAFLFAAQGKEEEAKHSAIIGGTLLAGKMVQAHERATALLSVTKPNPISQRIPAAPMLRVPELRVTQGRNFSPALRAAFGNQFGSPSKSAVTMERFPLFTQMKIGQQKQLPAPPPTTLSLSQVARLKGTGRVRGEAFNLHLHQLFGGQREVFASTKLGARFHDVRSIMGTRTVLAVEGKNYLAFRTVQGQAIRGEVPLSGEIQTQILKDFLWMRAGRDVGQHRIVQWQFGGAPPASDLRESLLRRGFNIVYPPGK